MTALEQKVQALEKALASVRAHQAQVATGTASCKAAAGSAGGPVDIAFPQAFARPPVVSVALAGATASGRGKAGLSLFIEAAEITDKGFRVKTEVPPGGAISDCALSWIAVLPPAPAPS